MNVCLHSSLGHEHRRWKVCQTNRNQVKFARERMPLNEWIFCIKRPSKWLAKIEYWPPTMAICVNRYRRSLCYDCKWIWRICLTFVVSNFTHFRFFLRIFREPDIKRTICKRCALVLKPGVSADLDIDSEQNGKTKVCKIKCMQCGHIKRFVMNKNYDLWLDNEKSIKQIIVLDSNEKWIRKNVPMANDEKTDLWWKL